MCDICHLLYCPSSCPNAPLPKKVCTCRKCGAGIYSGDEAYNIDGDVFCEDCVTDARFVAREDA